MAQPLTRRNFKDKEKFQKLASRSSRQKKMAIWQIQTYNKKLKRFFCTAVKSGYSCWFDVTSIVIPIRSDAKRKK